MRGTMRRDLVGDDLESQIEEVLFEQGRIRRAHTHTHTHTSGTEKVPQRTCAAKIMPNFRVNFLVRFVKPLFYSVVRSKCSESSLGLFTRIFGFGVLFLPLNTSARPLNNAGIFQNERPENVRTCP